MPTTLSKPPADDWVYVALNKVMRAWHKKLHEADVNVGVLFAESETDDAPMKKGGFKVIACIRVVPTEMRGLGAADALLKITKSDWEDMDVATQYALLDHELSHLALKHFTLEADEENPEIKRVTNCDRDEFARPKLKTVRGDWMGGDGFKAVVERHGADAIEWHNAKNIAAIADSEKAKADGDRVAELDEVEEE